VAWHEALEDARDRDEAAIIVDAFAACNIDIGGVPAEHGGIAYMYARDRILARQQHLGGVDGVRGFQRVEDAHRQRGVLDVLRENDVGNVGIRQVVRGIVAVDLDPDRPEREERDAHFLLGRIEDEFGAGFATLDHVVTSSQGHPSGCPATEPQEVYAQEPYPSACPGRGGHGVRIYVADTGIVSDTVASCPWLEGVTGDDDPSVGTDGTILPYGGHGTFVAGVIRCLAPGTEIVVRNVFDTAGSALESDFVPKLYEGFAYGAEIFHVTVASPTRCNLPLMAFETWMEDLRRYKGVVCVAPAGNDESPLPHWPAAFPGLISVGALGSDWRSRAYFSDYGGWVDVYAPGQNLVNAFATGAFTCQVAPFAGETRTFTGMAQWSGTSFSTPIVTGLIAARMTRYGENAEEAAAALLAQARAEAIPGVGPALLPGCGDDEPRGGCGGEHRHHGCGCGCGCDHGGKHGHGPR
jgi:subtilisin family serine protease